MLRFWHSLLFIIGTLLCTAAAAQEAQGPQVAALAIDRSKGFIFGWAYDQPSREAAEARALKEVADRGGKGSVVMVWSGSGCGAYRTLDAAEGNAYGWGLAATREAADAIALEEIAKRTTKVAFSNVWACNSDKTQPFEPIFVDRNLPSVVIGQQEWLATNLNIDRFRNGDPIPHFTDIAKFFAEGNAGRPASFCYPSQPCEVTGRYYNYFAVIDSRGLAPAGWRVPEWNDFAKLIDFLGGPSSAGNRLRAPVSWPEWSKPVGNASGFNAKAVHSATWISDVEDQFAKGIVERAVFWTLTPHRKRDYVIALRVASYGIGDETQEDSGDLISGLSVRLLRVPLDAGAIDRGAAGYPAPKPVSPAAPGSAAGGPGPRPKSATPVPKTSLTPATSLTPSPAEQGAATDQAEVERLNAAARAEADRQLREVEAMKAKAKADQEAFEKASAAHRAAVAKAEAEAAAYARAKAAADAQAAEYAREKAAYDEAMRRYREGTKPK
ncbi:FISUMP domain-containing protein [Erythrobacter sp. WG]|uniref:FISUMP domain-containing protein n=1 Tax=Erythrobacter sp. WG TaxID=2985510 RepID=UPI00227097C7|nr:FISUMP domain-containing protein [Erythrobacter sp. WG]MCX9148307.1 DUF4189 domain-containing protein [Erythrobacter sp. WG]